MNTGNVIDLHSRRGPQLENGYTSIANELLEALSLYDFSTRELKLVMCIIRRTYGFHKLQTMVSDASLARACGMDRSNASKVIKRLVAKNVVSVDIGVDRYESRSIGINKRYWEWQDPPGAASGPTRIDEGGLTTPVVNSTTHEVETTTDVVKTTTSEVNSTTDVVKTTTGVVNSTTGEVEPSERSGGQFDHTPCGQFDHKSVVNSTTHIKKERNKEKENRLPPIVPLTSTDGDRGVDAKKNAGRICDDRCPSAESSRCDPDVENFDLNRADPAEAVATPVDFKKNSGDAVEFDAEFEADFETADSVCAADDFAAAEDSRGDGAEFDTTPKQPRKPGGRRICDPVLFERFWTAYPKKRSRGQASRTFARLQPSDEMVDQWIAAINRAKDSDQWREDGGRLIPHASTWLNAEGWLDEFPDAAYSEQQRAVMDAYNQILADEAGWPAAVDAPYSPVRATAIEAFNGFSDKPDMAQRYFEHCLNAVKLDDWCGFDWLISKSTYLRIREGVVMNRSRHNGRS